MKMTGFNWVLLACFFSLASGATFDLLFRDQVEKKKIPHRPAEYDHGTYLDQPQSNYNPTYQDEYDKPHRPNYPSRPDYDRPTHQDDYQPNYQDEYRPSYQDDYKPHYQDHYRPNHQDKYKPAYQDDYKPSHQDKYKPTYQDDYRPDYEHNYKPDHYDDGYKPNHQDTYGTNPFFGNQKPFDNDDYKPSFEGHFDEKPTFLEGYKPDFSLPTYGSDFENQFKPPTFEFELSFNNDHFTHRRPQKPSTYNKPTYEEHSYEKPYQPAYKPAPKPYKPRPEYPKEVVLLTPSAALKSTSYAHKHTTKDYHASSVPGTPGKDYPNLSAIPSTSFDCLKVKKPSSDYGYMFADTETGCQVFHSCHDDGRQDSFLCPAGTIFDAYTQTCDWWFNTRCY